MNEEEIIKLKDLPKDLVDNPHGKIKQWAENRFKKIGEDVFNVCALMPHSIFIPPIPYEDTYFGTGISFLLLSPSGSSKTQIGRVIEQISIHPVPFEDISSAEIQSELEGKEFVTLVTGDAGRIFKDMDLLKVFEGILADSRVSKRNKREQLDYDIVGNCYMAGVPQDLTSYLTSGMLSRLTPKIIMHTKQQQDAIGKGIVDSIGQKSNGDLNIQQIKKYYLWLYQNQRGYGYDFDPIKGYIFSNEVKSSIYDLWKNYRAKVVKNSFSNYYRELIGGFKYLCASAFLNINNREIKNNMLVPTIEDLNLSVFLMHQELRTKIHILNMNNISKRLKDVQSLETVATQYKLSDNNLRIIKMLIENKR